MKKKKTIKSRKSKSKHTHGPYFSITYIRSISVVGLLVFLFLAGSMLHIYQESNINVLGASTSIYSCSWWNIICDLQHAFLPHVSISPSVSFTINQQQIGENNMQNTSSSTSPSPNSIPGYQTITDSEFKFSLQIPQNWIRGAELPAYTVGDNGKITPGPQGTDEQQNSFSISSPPNVSPVQQTSSGMRIAQNSIPSPVNFNFEIEKNDQRLSLVDFINKVIVPNNIQGFDGFYTTKGCIYTKQFGTNTATILETTRTNSSGSYTLTTIYGVYFARNNEIFAFDRLPAQSDTSWDKISTIISSFYSFSGLTSVSSIPQSTCPAYTMLPTPTIEQPLSGNMITGKFVGSDGETPIPMEASVFLLNVPNNLETTTNPWSLHVLSNGYSIQANLVGGPQPKYGNKYNITVDNGYAVYHSVCVNCTNHPSSSFVPGNVAFVSVNEFQHADVYFKYVKE